MIFPVKRSLKVFGTDSWDLVLNWKGPDGVPYLLSTWFGAFSFYVSKEDRTVVKRLLSDAVSPESRVQLADVAPNIIVFIKGDETQIGTAPDFTQLPGYYTFDLGPVSPQNILYRLMEGRIHYEL